MSLALAILVGCAPSLVWLWLVWRHDDHEREPWPLVGLALGLGAASTFAVLWTRPWLEQWLPQDALADAFLVTAAGEEAWKLLALLPLLLLRELDEPLDGAVYGAAVGFGFAGVENVIYAQRGGDLDLLLQRAFTATLVHGACTGCLGFCHAMGKLRRPGIGTVAWLVGGLLLAVVLHGCYDHFLDGGRTRSLLSLLVVLPAALLLLALKVRWARGRSPDWHPRP